MNLILFDVSLFTAGGLLALALGIVWLQRVN
jgi:hypothetical protein